jgi:hypothetical protein
MRSRVKDKCGAKRNEKEKYNLRNGVKNLIIQKLFPDLKLDA